MVEGLWPCVTCISRIASRCGRKACDKATALAEGARESKRVVHCASCWRWPTSFARAKREDARAICNSKLRCVTAAAELLEVLATAHPKLQLLEHHPRTVRDDNPDSHTTIPRESPPS